MDATAFSKVNAHKTQSEPVEIALSVYTVGAADGTGMLPAETVYESVDLLNNAFSEANLHFFILDEIQEIGDDGFYYSPGLGLSESSADQQEINKHYSVDGAINIYFAPSYTSDGAVLPGFCGRSHFPEDGIDKIFISNYCASGELLTHEMGHFFSLYHTFEKMFGKELVNGSNCEEAGDLLCDTPADQGVSNDNVNELCEYQSKTKDENGDYYAPDTENFMAYATNCMNRFSDGQIDRIIAGYQTYKTYLIDKPYAALFSAKSQTVCTGQEVHFEDQSIGAAGYHWIFEGGNPATSTAPNPVVTYSDTGNYDVSLVITGADGETSTKLLHDYVQVAPPPATNNIAKSGSFEEDVLSETIINPDQRTTFEVTTTAASDGDKSISIKFYEYWYEGREDYLVLGKVNNALRKTCHVAFDYAYAPHSEAYANDILTLMYRDACGYWNTLWEKAGKDLQTSSEMIEGELFIPEEDEWQTVEIGLDLPDDMGEVEFAFKTTNKFGNALYIDNYRIEPVPAKPTISSDGEYLYIEAEDGLQIEWFYEEKSIAGSDQPAIQIRGSGDYRASVSNDFCTAVSAIYTIPIPPAQPLAVDDAQKKAFIIPNPVVNHARVSLPDALTGKVSSMTLRNISGQVVHTGPYTEGIDVRPLVKGIYFLELQGDRFRTTIRFIKN